MNGLSTITLRHFVAIVAQTREYHARLSIFFSSGVPAARLPSVALASAESARKEDKQCVQFSFWAWRAC
jgi:hypothetical protein